MSKHFRVPSRLPAKLNELGIPVSAVLRTGGLRADLFDQVRVLVSTEEFFALWRAIGHHSGDPAIGLLLGTESRPEAFDTVALAALSSGNFGEAIQQIARYKQLSCPEEIVHESIAGEWSIQFRWLLAVEAEPDVLTDLCFAWVLSIARLGTGTRIAPIRIELVHPRASFKLLERHFGCPVISGATRNAIVFRAADATAPFVTRNAELLSMLAPQLDEELKQHRGQESFTERVRAAILRKLAGRRPKMQEIALELHISTRTLQRRLQDGGFSFQQVLEEARHQLARHYLNNSLLELGDAAYLLGYEDSNSFVRAFRTWEGIPPAHWRETQREKAVFSG
jgi:AraC-like DNA-binding protein